MVRCCLALLALSGCAVPGYTIHTYRFEGRIVEDATGAPVAGATVAVSARTSPFRDDGREGAGTTAGDGTFEIEITDGWCETVWIFPPLGTIGGSGMTPLDRVIVRVNDGPAKTIPVLDRAEAGSTIRHRLAEFRR